MKSLNLISSLLLFFLAFSAKSIDSTAVKVKVGLIENAINNNSDSTETYLDNLLSYAKQSDNKYAYLEHIRLTGFNSMKKGSFRDAIDLFQQYINQHNQNLSQGIVDQKNRIGMCYKQLGSYDTAFNSYQKAISMAENLNYKKGIADGYTGLGQVQELQGNYKSAIKNYLQSYDVFEVLNDSLGLSTTLNNIGNVMFYQQEYDQALEYYKESATIDKLMNNKRHLASSYGNIGMIYNLQQKQDSALHYNLRCMSLFEELGNVFALGTIYNNIALVYSDLKDYKKSIDYHLKSIEIKKQIGDKNGLATSYLNVGKIYVEKENLPLAKSNFELGLKMAKELKSGNLIMNAYNGLSKVYKQEGNFQKALDMHVLYSELNDSLINLHSKNQITQLETQFEAEKKEKQIAKLELEKQEKELEIYHKTSQRNIILSISIIIGLILIFILYYWVQKQKSAQKTIALNKERINSLLKDNEIQYVNAVIEGQEKERKRIAQDLHDRIGSMLSTAKLHFSSMKPEDLNKAEKILDESIDEVRKTAHNLSSSVLVKFGLIPSVQSFVDSIPKEHLNISFISHGMNERIDFKIEQTLYRTIQELLSNIIKHAEAEKVTLQLLRNQDGINLIVEDNGKGFDTKKEVDGIGLKNIKSRIDSVNGSLEIDSVGNKGTTVIVNIPIKND